MSLALTVGDAASPVPSLVGGDGHGDGHGAATRGAEGKGEAPDPPGRFDSGLSASALTKNATNQSVLLKDLVHCVQKNLHSDDKRVRGKAGRT